MPAVTIARLPSAADPVVSIGPWLSGKHDTLWLTSSIAEAEDLRTRLAKSIHVVDLQSFADELIEKNDPSAKPLRPRHLRMLAAEIQERNRPMTFGESARIAGTVAELKRAGIPEKRWPKLHHKLLTAWERARVTMGILAPEDRLIRAAKDWSAEKRGIFSNVKSVVISGFDSYTVPEYELVSALANSAEAVMLVLSESASLPAWIDEHDEPERIEVEPILPPAIHRIHAPGLLGECRMVARQLREWFASGMTPSDVVITSRHPETIADQLVATFADYGIPLSGIDPPPLSRCPSVATLLRAWRLSRDDFPFAGVGELLRSGWFQPSWPENQTDRELPAKSESLLRKLDRPSGRESYLAAVEQKIVAPFKPLEDEAGDRTRQERIEALAAYCQPFLKRFFQLWDEIPEATSALKWIEQLRAFAAEMGMSDDPALALFWQECEQWAENDAPALKLKRLTLAVFTDTIEQIATDTAGPVQIAKDKSVSLLSPDEAKAMSCDVLVVMDLAEGSFPDSTAPDSLLTDGERVEFESELLPTSESRIRDEHKLFTALIGRPRKHLLLSRPAVDSKGQEVLPSSMLFEWEAGQVDLSTPIRKSMVIEGFAEGTAYSATERRVQLARKLQDDEKFKVEKETITPQLANMLRRSKLLAERRFRDSSFNEFDGKLSHEPAVSIVQNRFAAERTISPSSLEKYVECPFRFWLENVLLIEELEEPTSEIEVTRRGQAVHRAMARYHRDVRGGKTDADVPSYISQAAEEYGDRSGTSLGRMLWKLEGKRLQRSAAKYAKQLEKFREDWAKCNTVPVPVKFEQPFGSKPNPLAEAGAETIAEPLVIEVNGVTVKIGGTIDRIDAVELEGERGFWVIDYKTGRRNKYTAPDVVNLTALQLPLYALAVERTVFKDRPARPLGMAYWMIGDGGSKTVLPGRGVTSWLNNPEVWPKFREQLEAWVVNIVTNIRSAMFPLAPQSDNCTSTCPFGPTCRIAQSRSKAEKFNAETAKNI